MTSTKVRYIGLAGFACAGKDEAAKVLIREFGFQRVALADSLKEEVACLINTAGLPDDISLTAPEDVREIILSFQRKPAEPSSDPFAKPTSTEMRRLLQWYGSEYRRVLYGDDYWILRWKRAAQNRKTVCTDIRFENEVDMIRGLGGQVWVVRRPSLLSEIPSHVSECLPMRPDSYFDFVLVNDGTIGDLEGKVREAVMACQNQPAGQTAASLG